MVHDGDVDWISLSELARRRGVSRQAVHKEVHKLAGISGGALELRPCRGEMLVSVAAYERVTGLSVPPPLLMGQAEYARHRGVGRSAVADYVRRGWAVGRSLGGSVAFNRPALGPRRCFRI